MKNIAIIFAGGVGKRMGSESPKQFLEVYGKPIIIHTLEKFQYNEMVDEIVVACNKDWIQELKALVLKYQISKLNLQSIVPGGKTGQDSIFCALSEAANHNSDDSVVLIHDGVRPIITDELINECILTTKKKGSAVTCVKVKETPVFSNSYMQVDRTVERDHIYLAKAPQCYHLGDVLDAHKKTRVSNPDYKGIVDTCTLMLANGIKSIIVEGSYSNIKVTTPSDYIDLIARYSSKDYKNFFNIVNNK